MFEAVIFDMDGLMLDSERLATESSRIAGKEIGIILSDELLHSLIGLNEHSASRVIEQYVGHPIDHQALSEAFYRDYEQRITTHGIPIKEGLLELMAFLDNNNIRRAVATSTKRELALRKLESANILSHFEHIVAGDDVEHGKPAPDPYLKAASQLNIPVENCLALEDSNNGAMSAISAGMNVIVIPDIKQPSIETRNNALSVLENLHHVIYYIENLESNIILHDTFKTQ